MTTIVPEAESARLSRPDEEPAQSGKAPAWLRRVIALIESEAGNIAPIKDDRGQVPEYIYRH